MYKPTLQEEFTHTNESLKITPNSTNDSTQIITFLKSCTQLIDLEPKRLHQTPKTRSNISIAAC
jgi:hypothetical protein